MKIIERAALLAVLAAGSACEPCAGVAACREAPRLAVEGRIVDAVDGHAISGASITVVRRASGTQGADSSTTTTDATGFWQIALAASSTSPENVDVVVAPPGKPAYRVKGLSVAPTTVHGDGQVLGVWVANLYFPDAGEFYYRSHPDKPVAFRGVEFDRTGGTELTGPGWNGSYASFGTDASGRIALLGTDIIALTSDELIGNIQISLNDGLDETIEGIHLVPTYLFRPPGKVVRIGVGPNLTYTARVYRRANAISIAGATVEFHRTGGIQVSPSTFTTITDASGGFVFPLDPLAFGTLVGDLTVRPPGGAAPVTVQGLALSTFKADGSRFLTSIGVGPHLPWTGIVHAQGKGIAGVRVDARRVGGVATDPDAITSTSDANGVFPLYAFAPQDTGSVIVDLTFHPPAPYGDFVIRNVVLKVFDIDSDARIIAVWDVDRANAAAASGGAGARVVP